MPDSLKHDATDTVFPAPFSWVSIPGGKTTLTDLGGYLENHIELEIAPFDLAKYPITEAQFQAFVDARDGYSMDTWWSYSDAAQLWHLENPEPHHVEYVDADHPRVHVAWYEAVAFCQWLAEKTGDPVRLPTEGEWQRAAQGDSGRTYPWGDAWEPDRCTNNAENQCIGTAPVSAHSGKGDSDFGVVDMAGNVAEWCLTSWNTGRNTLTGDGVRVLRGGSWFDATSKLFRTTARQNWNPGIRSDLRGYRIVRAPQPSYQVTGPEVPGSRGYARGDSLR